MNDFWNAVKAVLMARVGRDYQGSEKVSVAAPFSFQGSAERIWRVTNIVWYRLIAVLFLIPTAWTIVLGWYMTFGLLVVPYRMIRRSQRNKNLGDARHREVLNALGNKG